MRRTNPLKGRDQIPCWEPITWDEALATLADKLKGIRAAGLVDGAGYPRLAATFGSGDIAPAYLGTFAAFLAAWGPVDQGIGGGQGVQVLSLRTSGRRVLASRRHCHRRPAALGASCSLSAKTAMPRAASPACPGTPRPGHAACEWVQFGPYLSVTGGRRFRMGAHPTRDRRRRALRDAPRTPVGAGLARHVRRAVPRAHDQLALPRRPGRRASSVSPRPRSRWYGIEGQGASRALRQPRRPHARARRRVHRLRHRDRAGRRAPDGERAGEAPHSPI